MKERPILFSAPMVRALLAGAKSQTRRVVKGERASRGFESGWYLKPYGFLNDRQFTKAACPYGQPGERLWVRETLEAGHLGLRYAADDAEVKHEKAGDLNDRYARFPPFELEPRPVPSIHMPRWASRILLEVTDVRIERLQAISDADAVAEGTPCYVCGGPMDGSSEDDCHCFHRKASALDYRGLWEHINGPDSWDANPFVWAITFRRLP